MLTSQYCTFAPSDDYSIYNVVRRTGDVVSFNTNKIAVAITKAYIAVHGHNSITSNSVRAQISNITEIVVNVLRNRRPNGGSIHIEEIQDQVELALMRNGEYEVARSYIIYREERAKERAVEATPIQSHLIHVINKSGDKKLLDNIHIYNVIKTACNNLANVDSKIILDEALRNLYDGVHENELYTSIILASRSLIEQEPAYNFVTARLLLHTIVSEVLDKEVASSDMQQAYETYFVDYLDKGIASELISPQLKEYDLIKLANALDSSRDLQFKYLGLQTLYDRYFLHISGKRIELPQIFFMRVAMGLAMKEADKDNKAIQFYNVLSTFDFMSSTPTLFNSGTLHSQLSSCYLTTVADDLAGIYDAIKENALLSKFAGGLGNDWTNVRATGGKIKGTNGTSQGVIP
ncbi:MAG: ribonucleoside-diphosphate reductase subunit alpha, partial [Burkholderiales bacterium]|nr:ribonucleoside-diphosphate reductase subunit alpha [Burkholderiales bacterium]